MGNYIHKSEEKKISKKVHCASQKINKNRNVTEKIKTVRTL